MVGLAIPLLEDAFQGELLERGDWLVANLDTSISWPIKAQKLEFRGHLFWILPLTRSSYPAIALKLENISRTDAQALTMRLLSAMSWVERSGVMVRGFGGGSLPRPEGRAQITGSVITAELELPDLPAPTDQKALLALALLREGRGLNHAAYSFLSYYRVIEVACPPKQRGAWINGALPDLEGYAKEALGKLQQSGIQDVARHIYEGRRMAIAHAAKEPIIDPDDPAASRELRAELPVMLGLAELAIERLLGVKSRTTIYREHLYELDGFKRLLGESLVQQIIQGEAPAHGTLDLPEIDVELHGRGPYGALQRMAPLHAQLVEGGMVVTWRSSDALVELKFELSFADERLKFDWQDGIKVYDDQSSAAAINARDVLQFTLDYVGNGRLEIFDADTRERISRVDAFIPVNYFANHEWFENQIGQWDVKARERAAAGSLEQSA